MEDSLSIASERPQGPTFVRNDERGQWLRIGWRVDFAPEPILEARECFYTPGMDIQGGILAHHSICVHIGRTRNVATPTCM